MSYNEKEEQDMLDTYNNIHAQVVGIIHFMNEYPDRTEIISTIESLVLADGRKVDVQIVVTTNTTVSYFE